MTLEEIANFVTVVGLPLGVASLWWSARQLQHSAQIAEGTFMLELEGLCSQHDEVHRKLRPGGEWTSQDAGPSSIEEWAAIEDYMGFFEHCELLIRKKSISPSSFQALFGYRVANIVANKKIVTHKLESDEAEYWELFTALRKRLNI